MSLKYISGGFERKRKNGKVTQYTIAKRTHELGITEDLIQRALSLDKDALTEIGQKGKEGRLVQTAMPLIAENAKSFLQGLSTYKKGIADIYIEGGNADHSIREAESRVVLGNTKYLHNRRLAGQKFALDKKLESQRYNEQSELNILNAYVSYWLSSIDHQGTLDGTRHRIEMMQLNEDERYQMAQLQQLLQYGDVGNEVAIPYKDYTTVESRVVSESSEANVVKKIQGFVKRIWGGI